MVGIGAAGVIGIALEATPGTYVPPDKFFPIRNEGLSWTQNTIMRRVIRQTVDPIGAVPGDGHVEGDIDMECLEDVMPYILACSRGVISKSGTSPAFTYEFVANHAATPAKTASLTIVRAGEVFGYSGMVVASQNYSIEDGMLVVTFSWLGRKEEEENSVSPTFADDQPFGSGTYKLEIPKGTQVKDTDNLTFQVEDNGEPQMRLKDELGAEFIKYGERNTQISVDRDFEDRAEYDAFKAVTNGSLLFRTQKSDDSARFVEFDVPTTIKETYEVGLSGVGDLVRASINYQGVHNAALGAAYKITVGTDEDVSLA